MDDRDHGPLPHGIPPSTPSAPQPIPASSGIMALMVYQDGTTSDHSEHIATAAYVAAKAFLDGNAPFNPAIASIPGFLNNYLFDSDEDKQSAYQETARKFKLLGYSVSDNGTIQHHMLNPTPAPTPLTSYPPITTITSSATPSFFDNGYNSPLTNFASSGHPSPCSTPRPTNHNAYGRHSTTPLDYVPVVEAPQPTAPINLLNLDRRSPTAPPNLASQTHTPAASSYRWTWIATLPLQQRHYPRLAPNGLPASQIHLTRTSHTRKRPLSLTMSPDRQNPWLSTAQPKTDKHAFLDLRKILKKTWNNSWATQLRWISLILSLSWPTR
ncbi:hypothetical protein AX17_006761 [Amanita inopinata Kibby_2008]|nr:hypothetical protein AX17_006761 [Amanita inopinata Kibby_2008]